MFVCDQSVCRQFAKKKESLYILAFKYLSMAMFIWQANIYCTND